MRLNINYRLLYTLFSLFCIIGGSILAIQYAQGKIRFTPNEGIVRGTGLLSATSDPKGAQLLVDGKLVSATDDTIYLEPNTYQVTIAKEGYHPWHKALKLESELVTATTARLFPTTPSLSPVTLAGVNRPIPSPDGQKLAFYTASQSASTKNGWYLLELGNTSFPFQRGARQLLPENARYGLAKADLIWSPDSTQLMVITPRKEVLINPSQTSDMETATDISARRKQILSEWEQEMLEREKQYLREFPPQIVQIATQSATNVFLSPDKKRLLYTATQAEHLADQLLPPIPAASSQAQERQLKPGTIYVYDREEDRNFAVGTADLKTQSIATKQLLSGLILPSSQPTASLSTKPTKTPSATARSATLSASRIATPSALLLAEPVTHLQAFTSAQTASNFMNYHSPAFLSNLQWFPDSRHLLFATPAGVQLKEYDNTNEVTLYAGPASQNFVYPWPDGSRALILTTFNPTTPLNLYAIELR